MSWETELAKAENNTLRQAGDLKGIIAKYQGLVATGTWQDAPQLEALEICQFSLATWTETQMNEFRNGTDHLHATTRDVLLTQASTRTWVQANVTSSEWDALEERFYIRPTLAADRSLTIDKTAIRKALLGATDTPQYARKQATQLMASLQLRVQNGELTQTSLANLQTINSILGS